VLVLLAILATGSQAALYEGSLSTPGGLTASPAWSAGSGSTLRWAIDYASGSWHYEYTLTVPAGEQQEHAISHMLIEASSSFSYPNIWNANWDEDKILIQNFDATNGNPGMPGSVYGIKFDDTADEGIDLTIFFDSDRAPVWGDFYAKNGDDKTGEGSIYLHNAGFSLADPLALPADGSVDGLHLLVPDTMSEPPVPVPVPGAVLLGSVGLSVAGYVLRRKEQVA
jgi:hypothetical protein